MKESATVVSPVCRRRPSPQLSLIDDVTHAMTSFLGEVINPSNLFGERNGGRWNDVRVEKIIFLELGGGWTAAAKHIGAMPTPVDQTAFPSKRRGVRHVFRPITTILTSLFPQGRSALVICQPCAECRCGAGGRHSADV